MNKQTVAGLIIFAILALLLILALRGDMSPRKAEAQAPSVTMLWTAPGDDADAGRAFSYAMRYSRTAPGADTVAWWGAANVVPSMPVPSIAGATDSVRVTLGAWSQQYFFILTASDEAGNVSGWSNVAALTTSPQPDLIPPGRVKNLHGK